MTKSFTLRQHRPGWDWAHHSPGGQRMTFCHDGIEAVANALKVSFPLSPLLRLSVSTEEQPGWWKCYVDLDNGTLDLYESHVLQPALVLTSSQCDALADLGGADLDTFWVNLENLDQDEAN